jgi:DNA-binding CsgD family transcriptional regulator
MLSPAGEAGVLTVERAALAVAIRLTPCELQLLVLLADGHTIDSAAAVRSVAKTTAKFHLSRAKRKLGAKTTAHAVVIAYRAGILPPAIEDGE